MTITEDLSFIMDEKMRKMFEEAIDAVNTLYLWDWLSSYKGSVIFDKRKEIRDIENQLMHQGIPYNASNYTYIIHNMQYIASYGFAKWKLNVMIEQNEKQYSKIRDFVCDKV